MNGQPARLMAAVALMGGTLAGCGSSGQEVHAGGLTILIAEPADSGDSALLSGTLKAVGSCLGIDDYAVIWPHGTKVRDEDPLTVDVPGFPAAALGQKASVGGGVLFDPDAQVPKKYAIAGVTLPEDCVAAGVWMGSP